MNFKDVQKLKNEGLLVINNINYSKVMAAKLYPEGIKFTLKCIVLTLLYDVELKYINNSANILISYNNPEGKRKDQDYIIKRLKQIVENYNEITCRRKRNMKRILRKFIEVLLTMKKNKNIEISFFYKLRVSALEVYFKNIEKELKKINFNEKLYISFCDSYLEENLFTQYLNNKNILTSTLQHGQYRCNKEGYETTDVEAYLNFVSDYLFSWGEITKNEFVKSGIEKDKILNVGALKEFTDREKISNNNSGNIFGVILNGETHSKSNIEMIKLANTISENYKLKYYIRPHPMNKLDKYTKYVDDRFYKGLITDSRNYPYKVDFSILHMTAVFVEMLSYNVPFFVWNDEWTEEIFKIELITIKNYEEFEKKYRDMKRNREGFLKKLDRQYIKFNCSQNEEELENNYKNAINKILKGC